jgi:hypothetical protein
MIVREEQLKNEVAADYFKQYDCTPILGDIDFAVRLRQYPEVYLLWAEAKRAIADTVNMLTQLVLTVGKARTFDKVLPPRFLGCFDTEKIAFVPYHHIQHIFYLNDFNWNVAPSNVGTKEFNIIAEQIREIICNKTLHETLVFFFKDDDKELRRFIAVNFVYADVVTSKIKIDWNNFITIYNKWLKSVRPTIQVNWDKAKKVGIIDGDFYLADILSDENRTLPEKLFVVLESNHYKLDREINETRLEVFKQAGFSDNQKAHNQFWAIYDRPPQEAYWSYIMERRDLLVPQDIRERQGSFFTPQIWVERSQDYIAAVFGRDWQDRYVVWDCCAGTGNLLVGLTNKDNLWASTIDKADVAVMHERVRNGANLWPGQIFQFDFLNDEFLPCGEGGKLPDELYRILTDEKKRKNLIVYINPPYAEDTSAFTVAGTGRNRTSIAANRIHDKYADKLRKANHEMYVQFLIRIYCEIPTAKIAHFSTLKYLVASNFSDFRKHFRAKLEKVFLVPADSFDNVKGKFPIGFFIWNTEKKEAFKQILADIYNKTGQYEGQKTLFSTDCDRLINEWVDTFKDKNGGVIGLIESRAPDFQNNHLLPILSKQQKRYCFHITRSNLIEFAIYFAVRKVIPATWKNNRDQFFFPNDGWKDDTIFQNDCLAYTLFHASNNIKSEHRVNHWIPFTEQQVGAKDKFQSRFMADFIAGKSLTDTSSTLFPDSNVDTNLYKRHFSLQAQAVFDSGRELWKYYHLQSGNHNVNASFYDIRAYFQGRDKKGRMNKSSTNEKYGELLAALRAAMNSLAKTIEPKIYAYGFLK